MEEFDLGNIWKAGDDAAHEYYEQIRPELLEKSKQKSRGLISKVKRNTKLELWFSVLIAIIIPFIAPFGSAIFWVFIGLNVTVLPWAFYHYLKLNRKLDEISTDSVLEALKKEIAILSKFVRRLTFYTLVVMPIGYFAGVFSQMYDSGSLFEVEDLGKKLLVHVLISIPILSLMGWFFIKKYIYWLYGKPLKELKEIYHNLSNGID